MGNWSSNRPSANSRHAASRASICFSFKGYLPESLSLPKSRLIIAAANFTRPKAWISSLGSVRPEMGKLSTARWVCGAVIGLGRQADLAHGVVFYAKFGHIAPRLSGRQLNCCPDNPNI